MRNIITFIAITVCISSFSKKNTDIDSIIKAVPFPNTSVTLNPSWVKDHEDQNTRYLKSLDPDRLLHNFRVNAGLPSIAQPLDGWEAPGIGIRGHFTGHYLSAISSIVERYKDPILAKRLNYMVDELYKCQQSLGNGYLSAFPEKDFDILETQFKYVWAPYYTYHKMMQGLLDVYTRTGNRKAYEMVLSMASYVEKRMSKLDDSTIEKVLYTTEANPANEAGAMNDVLYKLYKISRDPRHLALAKIFDRNWFLIPLSRDEDILSGLHSNTHIVLVNGFAQRYSLTGEKIYHDAVTNFWDMLINHHAYVNGSSSGPRPNAVTSTSVTAEHWGLPDHLSNTFTKQIAESCVSHNTEKLTATIFTWTLAPKYVDAYMNTFYNSVMALQSSHSGRCVYFLPLGSPRKKEFLNENDFRCCNGTTIEAFASINSDIYYHNDSALWVNLYIPSKVDWHEKKISLTQTGEFPTDSDVELTVSTRNKSTFALKLFIPSWAENTDIYINNKKQDINTTPCSFTCLNREWKDNDKIRLTFHYNFHIKSMSDNHHLIALYYGPTLLAFKDNAELVLKGNNEDILHNITKIDDFTFKLNNNGHSYMLTPLYKIEDESYGVYATIQNGYTH